MLNIEETVDGGVRAFAVIEFRQRGQAPKHQRADQQGDRPGSVDVTQLGGLRAVEYDIERRRVLLGDAFAQCGDRGYRRFGCARGSGISSRSRPSGNQDIAVITAGAWATDSA